jgi:hypothetical protein
MDEKQKVTFREILPAGCPPIDANLEDEFIVIRLAKTGNPTQECFHSHAVIGLLPVGDNDPCEFASCSFFRAIDPTDYARSIKKLPNFKKYFTHAFFMTTCASMGKYRLNKKTKHVDVWFYSSFDPVAAVTSVSGL